MLKGNKW